MSGPPSLPGEVTEVVVRVRAKHRGVVSDATAVVVARVRVKHWREVGEDTAVVVARVMAKQ
jgi:hypothetical protein